MLQGEMVEKLEETASAAALAEEVCFADDLLFFDFTTDPSSAASGELQHQAFLFQNWFDDDIPGFPEESGGGENEEEELEWLSNKDAFPALETSFEIPSHSHSSSISGGGGGGGWSGSKGGAAAATGVVGEGPNPFWVTAAAMSFCVPARPRSKGRTPRGRVPTAVSSPPAATATATKAERRRCRHCLAEETPQWRAGPEGPKTLCNACGVRYKSGRLLPEYRPASSPTFSAAIHSNSHRRVLEMRRQKVSHDRRSASRRQRRSLL